jgi:hypothetical protein
LLRLSEVVKHKTPLLTGRGVFVLDLTKNRFIVYAWTTKKKGHKMPRGLPDSVIYGTYKRVKNAGRKRPRKVQTTPFEDFADLVQGFAEIARILKSLKGK